MGFSRLLKHLMLPAWRAPGVSRAELAAIRRHCGRQTTHRGELRFVVEAVAGSGALAAFPPGNMRRLFARLRVWDTEENSGILIYVQLVDRRVEILAIGALPDACRHEWDAICRAMEQRFRAGDWLNGALEAVERPARCWSAIFPATAGKP